MVGVFSQRTLQFECIMVQKMNMLAIITLFIHLLIVLLVLIFKICDTTLLNISTAQSERIPFPDGFKFGVSSSSHQIEGAWNEDGKGENIWDRFAHEYPTKILDHSNGDIACDSYHHIEEDVNNLKWLGVDYYRFSLSWSRILPSGYVNQVNEAGVRYYNELIDTMLARGVQPMVTLYQWDLPQPLHEAGGWPNPLIADFFVDYATLAFRLFGDRVKYWITFNEPYNMCQFGYSTGEFAPGYTEDGIGGYMCGRTLLLAHARAYRAYYEEFHERQQGQVGMAVDSFWYEPATNSTADIDAAETAIQMTLGWWVHPIFSIDGNYPPIMIQRVAQTSSEENFPRSRLPAFSPEEVDLIRGTADFFGLNHYTSRLVSADISETKFKSPSLDKDIGANIYIDPSWEVPPVGPAFVNLPWGFRKLLNWIREEYNNPEVYITENGWPDVGQLQDTGRILYLTNYLEAMLKAIHEDNCNVRGYSIWSLMDNWEWTSGYTAKFGLFYVNFTSPERTRIAKASARFYRQVIEDHALEV